LVIVAWQFAFASTQIYFTIAAMIFINPYGISFYNRKDLHCHQRVVIEFTFTYAVRDQLAANLYHEQKSNLQK
jgi:hypothetical protein